MAARAMAISAIAIINDFFIEGKNTLNRRSETDVNHEETPVFKGLTDF